MPGRATPSEAERHAIDHPQAGDGEDICRQDSAVRSDDPQIGVESRQLISKLSFSKPGRLQNLGTECERGRLHFGRLNAMTPTARTVWLSDDPGDDVSVCRQRLQ